MLCGPLHEDIWSYSLGVHRYYLFLIGTANKYFEIETQVLRCFEIFFFFYVKYLSSFYSLVFIVEVRACIMESNWFVEFVVLKSCITESRLKSVFQFQFWIHVKIMFGYKYSISVINFLFGSPDWSGHAVCLLEFVDLFILLDSFPKWMFPF